jgi:hypothetical protein
LLTSAEVLEPDGTGACVDFDGWHAVREIVRSPAPNCRKNRFSLVMVAFLLCQIRFAQAIVSERL